MKLLFASDIHGSAHYCRALLDAYSREKADKLILLGDILYHGPRNPLPEEYDPPAVAAMLNAMKEQLLCVRGNCDSEVDQMVLQFPIRADYAALLLENRTLYITHGHLFDQDNPPPLAEGDILMHGHTHLSYIHQHNGRLCMNPGSLSLPKGGTARAYIVYENGQFSLMDLSGEILDQVNI